MGYTTDFSGEFDVEPALKKEHAAYLKQFAETRRMKRDAAIAATFPDPIREAAGLPIGDEGAYFVGGGGDMGQGRDESITSRNDPPADQPGLWCQWVPSENGHSLCWDDGEKFYNYAEWLKYLIEHFLGPWGYKVNGIVSFQGEDPGDQGELRCIDNVVRVHKATITIDETGEEV